MDNNSTAKMTAKEMTAAIDRATEPAASAAEQTGYYVGNRATRPEATLEQVQQLGETALAGDPAVAEREIALDEEVITHRGEHVGEESFVQAEERQQDEDEALAYDNAIEDGSASSEIQVNPTVVDHMRRGETAIAAAIRSEIAKARTPLEVQKVYDSGNHEMLNKIFKHSIGDGN